MKLVRKIAIFSVSCGVMIMAVEFAIKMSRVRLPVVSLPRNNSGQVVHTHVPVCVTARAMRHAQTP